MTTSIVLCLERAEALERRAREVPPPPPLLNGDDVMHVLALKPGPHLRPVISALSDWARNEKGCKTREEALALLEKSQRHG